MKRKRYVGDMSAPLQCVVVREVVTLEVDQLMRRAHRRVRELDITMRTVALRMGVSPGRLSQLLAADRMSEQHFNNLTEALEFTREDWLRSLPTKVGVRDGYALIRERVRLKVERYRGKDLKEGKEK